MSEQTQNNLAPKPWYQSKKVWATVIGVVLAGLAAFFQVRYDLNPQFVLTLLGIVEGLIAVFVGTEAWKDGKVISANIIAEAEKYIAAAKEIAEKTSGKN